MMGKKIEAELLGFTQELIRINSISGNEENIIKFIASKMKSLEYDNVVIDSFGNVVGRVGNGEKIIMFDSHVDTVTVNDLGQWDVPPFSGEILDGWIWGRGSVDMKSGAAASIYAAAYAKKQGLLDGKSVYVSCTIFEEDWTYVNSLDIKKWS